ncbi:MAG TPA: pantoate--beta-alanine ligase [Planctomycetaceae bacterium]|nr:pantoate--beta-alanine ligase [Planctomycetaceae bacterium]HQZ63870.1 pantoate--beta-alanine ligase [Planctomycetaceae bacterium]
MIVESSLTETRRHVRSARRAGRVVGFVPTMGALHPGHVSLIEAARRDCDFVVASIFVNPTQFGPQEDFSRYPRMLEADLKMCRDAGADLVLTPDVSAMYPESAQTIVRVTKLAQVLEGAHRPGHFDGVSTVVTKLFNIAEPNRAYFGQKDYQQQLLIRQMTADLDLPIEIVTCPTLREADGLAMSSRNRYLSTIERGRATHIFQALQLASQFAAESNRTPPEIAQEMRDYLNSVGGIDVQYAVIADRATLEPLTERASSAVALIAAKVGTTRLIDNQILQFR